jgi:deazaflavin-dependent oxidoreductase (nitroreductase family)
VVIALAQILRRRIPDATAALAARVLRSPRLMRAPIWLYRMRLGFLFGQRLLLLEHVGRRTGRRRLTVLEVVGHPASDVYIVASGFGTRAQWFRNVQAQPDVRVSVGRRASAPARARRLAQPDADAALRAYIGRHRRAWKTMKPALESTLGCEITADDTALPLVQVELTQP